jgi:hypothetical protein
LDSLTHNKSLKDQQQKRQAEFKFRLEKTCFIFYALLRRLSAGFPTAFQVHVDRFFLFTSCGGSVHSTASSSASVIPAECWALADSNESIWQPCVAFLDSGAWVIQASSPQPSRWKEWTKQRRPLICDGLLFSRGDAHPWVCVAWRFATLRTEIHNRELLKLDRSALMSHFDDWGPSARTCINLVRDTKRLSTMVHDAWNAAVAFVDDPEVVLSTALQKIPHMLSSLCVRRGCLTKREVNPLQPLPLQTCSASSRRRSPHGILHARPVSFQ